MPPVQERRDSEKGARGRISVSSTSAVFTGHLRLMFRAHHDSIENDQALQACVQWWPHSMPHYCKHQLCWNHTPRTASHRQHNSSPPPSHSFFSGTSQQNMSLHTHTHMSNDTRHTVPKALVWCVCKQKGMHSCGEISHLDGSECCLHRTSTLAVMFCAREANALFFSVLLTGWWNRVSERKSRSLQFELITQEHLWLRLGRG